MNKWQFNGKLYENNLRVATVAQLQELYEYIQGVMDTDDTESLDNLDEIQAAMVELQGKTQKNTTEIAVLKEIIDNLKSAEDNKF